MEMTCGHCGHTGADVLERSGYVGGQGYRPFAECADQLACWARWDEQNGLVRARERTATAEQAVTVLT